MTLAHYDSPSLEHLHPAFVSQMQCTFGVYKPAGLCSELPQRCQV